MRFYENGPNIPDELLIGRDEGRVLFFCGAGVSRARASLPDFDGLARKVLKGLGALPDSPASKLINLAARLRDEPIDDVGSILAVDRIFGLLEREFSLSDIERVVGEALRPPPGVELGPHQTLLDLSRGTGGEVQLVTTNFDLLFEAAAPRAKVWTPAELPDVARQNHFNGIVHLHGRFDESYSRAKGGNLVLSSAEFGRAYLSEGWATEFIRHVISHYLVVFVGYAADDPPIQYLLEALGRTQSAKTLRLFAFQAGRHGQSFPVWEQKRVTAIPFEQGVDFTDLWRTLEAWADRARDPERWRTRLLKRAAKGPGAIATHERGQVVHLASHAEGARAIAASNRPIPAEWICVFDPKCRYGTPSPIDYSADPFTVFGLDTDPIPEPKREGSGIRQRIVPNGVVDVLSPNTSDREDAAPAALLGRVGAPLSRRLGALGGWFMKVIDQPAAIWWAAGCDGLHPRLVDAIQLDVDNFRSGLSLTSRTAWRYLLEAWASASEENRLERFTLQERIQTEGWTDLNIRAYANHIRPTLSARRPYGPLPPEGMKTKFGNDQPIRLAVHYKHDCGEVEIRVPDGQVPRLTPLLRRILEDAIGLENEISPYGLSNIPPIIPDPDLPGSSSDRDYGANPLIFQFTALFERLLQLDPNAARNEFAAWRQDDEPAFARLRVWAAGLEGLLEAAEAGKILRLTTDRLFWGFRDQRDLLLVLAIRWEHLPNDDRKFLERRLRKGLVWKRHDDPVNFPVWRARSIAERLVWLQSKGCRFSFDANAEIAKARALLTDWDESDAVSAANSHEGRGGSIHVDTTFERLAGVKIDDLVVTALGAGEHLSGQLLERDPLGGLIKERPVRLLAALRRSLISVISSTAWRRFLQDASRLQDKPKLKSLIARRLMQLDLETLKLVLHPIAAWLGNIANSLFEIDEDAARGLLDILISVAAVTSDPHAEKGAATTPQDWFDRIWNTSVGNIVTGLAADRILRSVRPGTSLPDRWKLRSETLLGFDNKQRLYAVASLSRHTNWLYSLDPEWTEKNLLANLENSDVVRDAFIAGFFSNGHISGRRLFDRLKIMLIEMATEKTPLSMYYQQPVGSLLITAWSVRSEGDGSRYLSDDELRMVIARCATAMRTHMLWHVSRWPLAEKLNLFRGVWPLQLAARSPAVTQALCSIALDDPENFPVLVTAILPFVNTGIQTQHLHSIGTRETHAVFERYPLEALSLLQAVLARNGTSLPYGATDALKSIAKGMPSLRRDPRFIDLWARRPES